MQYAYGLSMPFSDDEDSRTHHLMGNAETQASFGWNIGLGPNAMPHLHPPEPNFAIAPSWLTRLKEYYRKVGLTCYRPRLRRRSGGW